MSMTSVTGLGPCPIDGSCDSVFEHVWRALCEAGYDATIRDDMHLADCPVCEGDLTLEIWPIGKRRMHMYCDNGCKPGQVKRALRELMGRED
jgi:hypothetical protein